ncbi:MAG TPA: MFS transporter [Polyangiaceae bacterium]|nr:MFS transporter [Polyangiaceae bacterium]
MRSTPAGADAGVAGSVGRLQALGKLGLLGCLYFSQGLPFGFFTQALPVLLRKQGLSLGAIGLSSLLAAPWALKFLWAPLVDHHGSVRFGRRKSWIVPLQLAACVTLVALAFTLDLSPGAGEARRPLQGLFMAVFVLNLLAATQDVATDGLAVDLLSIRERGLANGLQVAGYRVGMIIGGGVLLVLYERLQVRGTFLVMAALTALATLPVLFKREPTPLVRAVSGRPSWTAFVARPGGLRIISLLLTYKAGDAFATGMLRPWLSDLGLSLADVGWLLGSVGFIAGLLGALFGGLLLNFLTRRRALVTFGILQVATLFAYIALARQPAGAVVNYPLLYVACAAEHFTSGMATAALFTCMMDWSEPSRAATDYTVQASTVVIASGAASALAGLSAQHLGYFAHFSLATLLAASSLIWVFRAFPLGTAAPASGQAGRASE